MRIVRIFACLFILVMLTGFQAEAQRKKKHDPEKAQETISEFKKVDTGIANFLDLHMAMPYSHPSEKGQLALAVLLVRALSIKIAV